MDHLPMPPYDELSRHLKYDPYNGIGTWILPRHSRLQVGALAGTHSRGYLSIKFKRKAYKAHRLFWFLQTKHDPGELTIDHIDQNKLNNKFINLRLANNKQQQYNISLLRNNTSGHKGVAFHKTKQKYYAYIKDNGRLISLGHYKTFEQAVAVRQAKQLELHGEFSPLHQFNNDQLFLDNNDRQLSLLWHPSF
jgi:hypothetical protein